MRDSNNPFEIINNQLVELKKIVLDIKNAPKHDFTNKYYSYTQVSIILHVSYQTIRNYVKSNMIQIEEFGPKRKLIHHYQIFNEDQTLKNFKYKRKAK